VTYDSAALFEVTDNTFMEAGGIALWTKADSVTRFDMMASPGCREHIITRGNRMTTS
jgi:hypothetical protein